MMIVQTSDQYFSIYATTLQIGSRVCTIGLKLAQNHLYFLTGATHEESHDDHEASILLGQESELELHPASPKLTQLGVCRSYVSYHAHEPRHARIS